MPTARGARPKSETAIQLRISEIDRDTIDAAAAVLGQTRTEFLLSVSRAHAVETLLNQRLFRLSGEDARAFQEALDAPAEPNDALRKLAQEPAPWE